MSTAHAETRVRHIRVGHPAFVVAALVLVVVAVAASMTGSSTAVETPATPSLERLRELASIYDGQQFGWVPFESWVEDTPAAPLTDAERMQNWLIRSQGGNPDTPGHSTTTPSLETLREMAGIYEGQVFGPAPLGDIPMPVEPATIDVTDPGEAVAVVDRLIEKWNAQDEEFLKTSALYMYPSERHTIERVGGGTPTVGGSVLFDIDYDVNGHLIEVVWEVRIRDGRVSFLHETAR